MADITIEEIRKRHANYPWPEDQSWQDIDFLLVEIDNRAPANTPLCIDCHHNNLVGNYCAEMIESTRCLKCEHQRQDKTRCTALACYCGGYCEFSRACGCRCVFGARVAEALFKPMCDDPDCWVCKRMAELHGAAEDYGWLRHPAPDDAKPVTTDARERAQRILWTFMQTIDGDRDYSCDKCELTTYLCPHLFERLQNLIAAALASTPAATTSSISAAIAVVERLRDEWDRDGALLRTMTFTVKAEAANEILTALRALQPSTPTTSAIEAAKELAPHIDSYFRLNRDWQEQVAAIITKHLPSEARAVDGDDGVSIIAAERQRQVGVEGWTPEHDDEHEHGEMAVAGAWYAIHGTDATMEYPNDDPEGSGWPWGEQWCKPKDDVIRNLARAGALIAAEIDRIKRRRAAITATNKD